MVMYGPAITEAKRAKGQEYVKLKDTIKSDQDVDNYKDIGGSSSNKYATTSGGKGGVLDSVAQHHIEDLDLEKEKIILESENILDEYLNYIIGNINKAVHQYGDNSKSQLEKRMVEDLSYLQNELKLDPSIIPDLIADNYYGLSNIMPGGVNSPEDLTPEKLSIMNNTIKTILRLRINYVNKITSLMSKMLKSNYKVLGLSEEQAKIYIDNLTSGTNDSVKTVGEIKELIKSNADKFMANGGEAVDLRPLGYGVILGPSKGYELNLAGTDGTNKDGMLSLIQQAMRYDVVVVAHGDDEYKSQDKTVNRDEVNEYLSNYVKEKYQLVGKAFGLLKIKHPFTVTADELSDMEYLNKKYLYDIKNDIGNNAKKSNIVFDVLRKYSIEEAKYLSKKYYDKYRNKIINLMPENFDEYNEKQKESIEKAIRLIIEGLFKCECATQMEYLTIDLKYDKYWSCQPTRTLQAGPFEDVDDLVRQLIKEGYKKILIEDCNPGGHKLAKDIMNTKGVLINHSNFSNFVESFTIDSNDEDLRIIGEAEVSLMEFADSYGIDYYNDEYLEECCQWYLENYEFIHEGERFDKLKEFFKRILAGIIGFIKNIFRLVKKAFHKLKSLFLGTKEEPKDAKSNFKEPIKTKLIDITSKKIVEITSKNREELNKEASEMCSKLAKEIKNINQKQQNSLKKIERDIEELSRKENSIKKESTVFDFMDSLLLEDGDLLANLELLREFEDANGPVADDEEEPSDFSMDDEGGEAAPAAEAPAEETPAEEDGPEEFSMDDEGEQPAEENPEGEAPTEDDEPEDFEIPDDEGTEGEQNPEGEAPVEDAPEDEEFSMDDAGDGTEGGEGTSDDTADDSMGDDTTSDNDIDPRLKDLEAVVFDNLSDKEKELKIKDLKELYITVYKKCGTISELLTDVKRDEETIQIVEYISNTLIDLKQYVNDYINDIFDSKTYVENLAQLQKYIMIFNAINKVFDQIKQENVE